MIKIPAEVKKLAEIFNKNKHKLYIVGGYVRDRYLNIQSSIRDDIDLCSDVTPKELDKILGDTEFEVNNINSSVGVMAITGKNRYEHATFRREIYEDESHNPDHVEFIKDLEEDAKRRDFKINAIYYDILEGNFVDPLGGILDLKEKRITTVKVPKKVFNDDPERILRLIRFACSLGLDIPEEEYSYAKQNSYKVQFMTKYRLKNEFEKLLNADSIYPDLLYTNDAHFRAMVLIGEFGLWKYILPSIDKIQNSDITDHKGERLYEHILNCLKISSPRIRLAVLLHDVGKFRTMERNNNFFGSKDFVNVLVENNIGINGLGYSNEEIGRVIRTIIGNDFNKHCLLSKGSIKNFIFENHDIVEDVIEIKTVIKNEGRLSSKIDRSAEKLRKVYKEMLSEKAPFTLKELAVNGTDVINAEPRVKLENLDDLLNELLRRTCMSPEKNNKADLVDMIHRVINSKRDYYLD